MRTSRAFPLRRTWLPFFLLAAIACGGATQGGEDDDGGESPETADAKACGDERPVAGTRCEAEGARCGPYRERVDCSSTLCDGHPSSSFDFDVYLTCQKGRWLQQGENRSGCCL